MSTTAVLQITAPADDPVIVTSRIVKAPPELVFSAWTEPEHLRNWWGPRRLELVVCELDLTVGGTYRFVHRDADGHEFGFHGEYREIERPSRLVATFVYEGMPDAEAVETTTFESVEGGTMVRSTARHPSIAARDEHLANGMESGMTESFERLDEMLELLTG